MATTVTRKRMRDITIDYSTVGLNTIHDPIIDNKHSIKKAQNARGRNFKLTKRNGTRNYSDEIAYGQKARATAIHQWYPATTKPDNRLYAVSGGSIYRFTKNNDGLAEVTIDATTASSEDGIDLATSAYDDSWASHWSSDGTTAINWITGEFTRAKKITSVWLGRQQAGFDFPKKATIQASADGVTYTDIREITIPDVDAATFARFGFDNDTAYKYYRLYFDDADGVWNPSGVNRVKLAWIKWNEEVETSATKMTFPSEIDAWANTSEWQTFIDFGDYCFGFAQDSYGIQMRTDQLDQMYAFCIDKLSLTSATDAGAGSISAGTYGYKIRGVREASELVREYWGAYSDAQSITIVDNHNVTLAYTVPTDPQITHIYVYRTDADGGTYFYHDRIAIADATGSYDDSTDTTGSTDVHDDVRSRESGFLYGCIDQSALFVVDEAGNYRHSLAYRPQEWPVDNFGEVDGGNGKVTGCAAYHGNVLVFKENGITVLRMNSSGFYDEIAYIPKFGNVAPWGVCHAQDEDGDFVSFIDNERWICGFTDNGIKQFYKIEKYISKYEMVTTDILELMQDDLDNNYKKYMSVGYKNGYLYCSYTPIGEKYNTKAVVLDFVNKAWWQDKGYEAGVMFTRLGGYGVHGGGELLAMSDGLSVRMLEVDANTTHDASGAKIEVDVELPMIGANYVGQHIEWQRLDFLAKLSNVFKVSVDIERGRHTQDFYIAPSGKYYYDSEARFGDVRFDDVVAALLDWGVFGDEDMKFDGVDWHPYHINLPGTCQGNWIEISYYDNSDFEFEISAIKITPVNRGYK